MEDEGLGRLPSHLPSAGALLLFNSRKTPYTVYDTEFDNLLPAELRKRRSSLGEADLLAALASAPESVVRGMALPDVFQIDYQCVHIPAPRASRDVFLHATREAPVSSS